MIFYSKQHDYFYFDSLPAGFAPLTACRHSFSGGTNYAKAIQVSLSPEGGI
jgi:hypothetical protein